MAWESFLGAVKAAAEGRPRRYELIAEFGRGRAPSAYRLAYPVDLMMCLLFFLFLFTRTELFCVSIFTSPCNEVS